MWIFRVDINSVQLHQSVHTHDFIIFNISRASTFVSFNLPYFKKTFNITMAILMVKEKNKFQTSNTYKKIG